MRITNDASRILSAYVKFSVEAFQGIFGIVTCNVLLVLCRSYILVQQSSEAVFLGRVQNSVSRGTSSWDVVNSSFRNFVERKATAFRPGRNGPAIFIARSNRRMERLDAISHTNLSLYWSIQGYARLRRHPNTCSFLPFHDRLRSHGLFLQRRRLYAASMRFRSCPIKSIERSPPICHGDGLSILLLRAADLVLVYGHLHHHANGQIKKRLYALLGWQDHRLHGRRNGLDPNSADL